MQSTMYVEMSPEVTVNDLYQKLHLTYKVFPYLIKNLRCKVLYM